MGKPCSPNQQKEIKRFSSFIGADSRLLFNAAHEICQGRVPSGSGKNALIDARSKLEEEVKVLIGHDELTECLLDAISVLRSIPAGRFIWEVFWNDGKRKCKHPLSKYNASFDRLRERLPILGTWVAQRHGIPLSDTARMILLYELFLRDSDRLESVHRGAMKVYRRRVDRSTEYMSPEFEPWITEFGFHAGVLARIERGIPPYRLWSEIDQKNRKSILSAVEGEVHRLGQMGNVAEFLKNSGLVSTALNRCSNGLAHDEELLIILGVNDSRKACQIIFPWR